MPTYTAQTPVQMALSLERRVSEKANSLWMWQKEI